MLYIIYCWIVYIISLKFTEIHQSHITDIPHTRVYNKLATQYQISQASRGFCVWYRKVIIIQIIYTPQRYGIYDDSMMYLPDSAETFDGEFGDQ